MKAKSFKDLGDLWKEKQQESKPKIIKSDLSILNQNAFLEPKEPLKEKALSHGPQKVSVTFHENFKSVKVVDEWFCNFLNKKKCYKEQVALKKIFSNENQICDLDSLPFNIDEDILQLKPRIKTILDSARLLDSEIKGDIGKGTYLDEVSKLVPATAKKGQAIRIYFKHQGGSIEILLIDLYHMFATTRKNELRKKYKGVSGYNTCMNTLRISK